MTVCSSCKARVEYIKPEPGDYISPGRHVHADGERDHPAQPQPTCPYCNSADYRRTEQPWGDSWDCDTCGHHTFNSLGD